MMKKTSLIALVPLAALLSGCSVSKMMDAVEIPSFLQPGPTQAAVEKGEKLDTIAFADAYCRGDSEAALAATRALVSAHTTSPKARLVHAMALDLAGRGVTAYRILEPLSTANHLGPAALKCGDDFIYSGTVAEVAQRRLFEVKTRLAALGMQLPLPSLAAATEAAKRVYTLAGKAPTRLDTEPAPVRPPEPRVEIAGAAPMVIQKAAMRDTAKPPVPSRKTATSKTTTNKSRFVHLGSYRSMKTLEDGWKTLRKRFGNTLPPGQKAVKKINLGAKKGSYLRLGVAVPDTRTAARLCSQLKKRGQYCAVMSSRRG